MLFTFVLEWENAILSELDRTQELLVQIHLQVQSRTEEFELLILHNSNQVEKSFIADFLETTLKNASIKPIRRCRIVDVRDAHYFELKNKGVQLAKGETVIILDSDIIPLSGWLDAMVTAHLDHPEAIIAGSTHIDYSDFIGKCFALAWFFPIPTDETGLRPVQLIFSNNFICKRQLLIDNPYPKMAEGITRGADTLLWKQLVRKGVSLYFNKDARASHPAPNGSHHFFKRALAEGRDDYRRLFEKDFYAEKPFYQFFRIYGLRCKKTITRIWKFKSKVDLKLWQVPMAILTMLIYYQFYFIGGLITKFTPKYAQVSWQI